MKTTYNYKNFFIQIILLIGLHFFSVEVRCQDAQFSQFYNSPLTMNPSLSGAFNGDIRMLANYRDQWGSISIPYKTFAFSFDMGLMKETERTGFLGAGISVLSDKAGSSQLGMSQVNLSLAYHEQISRRNTLSAGIMGGIAQRKIDFSKLQWNSQYNGNNYDMTLPSDETGYSENKLYPDFGAGLQWTYTKGDKYATANNQLFIDAGISFFHLNQPNISFYSSAKDNLPIKIVMHTALQIGFNNSKMSFIPSLLYVKQGAMKDIITGALLRIRLIEESKFTGFIKGAAISFGGLYRIGDAIIPQIQLEFAKYAIGFSYDVNTSGLTAASSGKGGLEISLRFINPNPFTGKQVSASPRFFN